ncbi:hypothetical protein KIPB_002714 [Kipferlia bialata]|uniref:Uncharacterized protein n=1 Tax=Kipferlia bialata TaxID=797122 RepID=A0A9K3CS75_9EUKA|nr:hypothetical protein KIPB_002714 [Kipferlia bialata]|eukprot:g2714.t1
MSRIYVTESLLRTPTASMQLPVTAPDLFQVVATHSLEDYEGIANLHYVSLNTVLAEFRHPTRLKLFTWLPDLSLEGTVLPVPDWGDTYELVPSTCGICTLL